MQTLIGDYELEDSFLENSLEKHRDTQETSIESYKLILPELGNRQRQVFDVISKMPNVCNYEIGVILGLPINSVTPRVKELRDLGLVVCVGTKLDKVSNRNVMIWGVK